MATPQRVNELNACILRKVVMDYKNQIGYDNKDGCEVEDY